VRLSVYGYIFAFLIAINIYKNNKLISNLREFLVDFVCFNLEFHIDFTLLIQNTLNQLKVYRPDAFVLPRNIYERDIQYHDIVYFVQLSLELTKKHITPENPGFINPKCRITSTVEFFYIL
jgi:hypothetical protein